MKNIKDLRAEIANLVQEYAELQYAYQEFKPNNSTIPPSGKVIDGAELQYMVDASLDGWLTTGRFNKKFEKNLSSYLGVRYALTVNSGSSANLLAFTALTSPMLGDKSIQPGDEVITVAAGFPTTVNPILQCGATPVFVDIDIPTYNINVELVEKAISKKTKAIMIAHTLGNPYNLKAIKKITKDNDLWLIEDCCDALGSEYNNKKVGSFGDIGTLSFYPAHHITMGEGGAVLTNNAKLKKIIESLRDWGRDCYCKPGFDNTCHKRFSWELGSLPKGYDHKYTYSHLGYNLKITDMQAACGLAQLEKIEKFVQVRKDNFDHLTKKLKRLTKFLILPQSTDCSSPSWFGYPITIKNTAGTSRVDLLKYLDQYKIGTRLLFAGNIVRQPYFDGRKYRIAGDLKNTDIVMNMTFWVGVYPGLGYEQLDYIANRLEAYFGINF